MSEAPVTEANVEETVEAKPPWERDGETFDPERAWKLVQNLKAELAAVKAKQAEVPEPTAAEEPAPEPEAKPSEAETSSEAQDDSAAQIASLQAELAAVKAKQAEVPEPTAAEEPAPEPEAKPSEAETSSEAQDDSAAQIASLQAELAAVKALAAVGLSQDFAPFVPGATSEEIEANLATLQKLISDAANEKTEAVLAAAPKSRGMAPNPAQHAAPARDAYEEAAEIIFG